MRIWFVNHYAAEPGSPSGTRHFSLAKALGALGHDVTLVAASFDHVSHAQRLPVNGPRSRKEITGGVRFVWLATPGYRHSSTARLVNMLAFSQRVLRLMPAEKSDRPEVVVGSSPHPFGALAASRLARRMGSAFVLEIRDLWPESLIELAGLSPQSLTVVTVDRVVRHLYKEADAIVGLMPGAPEAIAARGGASSKVTWIPNGIDLSMVPAPQPPGSSSHFTVMFAGNHGEPMALGDVVEAARIVAEAGRADIAFRLVGDGAEKPRLRRAVAKAQLTNVAFEDPVPKERVFDVLQQADAFVVTMKMAPLYRFGISFNKLFDYLASGRPIVFGNAAANDIVAEARAGFSVPAEDPVALADAIIRLADTDPAERAEMGRRGRDFVEANYDFSRLGARYLDVFEGLV